MQPLNPRSNLPTHEVINMPPHLGDQDLWAGDVGLREGVENQGGGWGAEKLAAFGRLAGSRRPLRRLISLIDTRRSSRHTIGTVCVSIKSSSTPRTTT
ncbi:MAG: hypothetical protein CM1200mP41_10940 [Gammaproteobacteria bacterium]|nr:MAG: hypothetical protein CM1200mP41_10940 [Gammaproteobacteria bacterium]